MKTQTTFFLLFCPIFLWAQTQKFSFTRPKMGSPFTIVARANSADSGRLGAVVEQAFRRIDTLNQIFSDYDSTSEISRLSRQYVVNQWFIISEEVAKMMQQSLNAAQKSKGAFDVTVGKIIKLWRKTRRVQQLPEQSALALALKKTGWQHIELDVQNKKIRFDTEGVELDFGGIVKGYAAQEAVRILSENGFLICFADAGGDLAIGNAPQNLKPTNKDTPSKSKTDNTSSTYNSQLITQNSKKGWSVGIGLPNAAHQLFTKLIYLENQAVATSGDMYQGITIGGKRYSHIVNPKTGVGLTHQRNVTVIAPDGALADWLATACSVLPIRRAMRLVNRLPQVGLLILENKNGKIRQWSNPVFEAYLK